MQHHLVIIRPRYLELLLAGKKRVECRLSKMRRAPYEAVHPGDLLWLKLPSGPVRAVAVAGHCRFDSLEAPGDLRALTDPHADLIRADPEFFRDAETWARYLSLIWIDRVMSIDPLRVNKSDPRSWVVLAGPPTPNMNVGVSTTADEAPRRHATFRVTHEG